MSEGRNPHLTVIGYAMWTAAGHDGPSTVAAMRAGVSGAEKANLWDSTAGEMLNAFRVHAHQWWEGPSFLAHLIAPVIEDCKTWLQELDLPSDVPVFINVSAADRPDRPSDLEQQVLDGLAALVDGGLPAGSHVIAGGRSGVPQIMARVVASEAPIAIIVGAESLLRQAIVQHYNDKGQLLSAANSSGLSQARLLRR